MKIAIILGSSRNDGDTTDIANRISAQIDCDIINLNYYDIGYYDYNFLNKNDDFLPLMEKLIGDYDFYVFGTPVYWYAMSGVMKVFFDRLTDLLEIRKDLGRKLKAKKMVVFSSSIGNNLGEFFWLPFSETASYFEMDYIGHQHFITKVKSNALFASFITLIRNNV